MLKKYLEGFLWGLGFFTVATVVIFAWEDIEEITRKETLKIELNEIELLSMNIDRVEDEMIFAGQFKSNISKFYENYVIDIDLFTSEGKFVSNCYRSVDREHLEKDKNFNYTLNCEIFSNPKLITDAKVRLYGEYKQ